MERSTKLRLALVALACGVLFALAAPVYVLFFSRHPAHDWMVYYSAARAYLEGDLPLAFDGDRLTAHMNLVFANWLSEPLTFHPWIYPPPFLLVLIPFGLLPFGTAYVLFLLTTFICLLLALWRTVQFGWQRCLLVFAILLSAPAAFTIGNGQNAFLSAALLVGGFGLLARSPICGGALLGLLTYKPQLFLLVPVALIAARQWRALGGAALGAAALALVSVAVFGIEPWRVWVEWIVNPPPVGYQKWLIWGRSGSESLYNNLVVLGATHFTANLGQALGALAAAACVWWSYKQPPIGDRQLVVLLAAAMLAAPHAGIYDAVLLVIAAALLFVRALEENRSWFVLLVPVAAWMIQFGNPPDVFRIGLLTPVATFLLLFTGMARLRAKPFLGAPETTLPTGACKTVAVHAE